MNGPLSFFVPGTPRPEGSFKPGRSKLRHASTYLDEWRDSIAVVAGGARRGRWPTVTGAVLVSLRFTFRRTNGKPYPTGRPDIDKLERAVLDALLRGQVIADDSLVVQVVSAKRWAPQPAVEMFGWVESPEPGVAIAVFRLEEPA